ncbi:hypothetical protein DFQ27_009277 [Actinomortierella ambigua]|uniref:Crinkler effector protein N-terminal domain-containing protein n=1 Tax=Actinomortierella ambigua TaxID=1343610 RepID=A0A9P6PQE1_9FUNG|nr:hypothetical protein DFQ27_009277 [Actinomortierella ambigua]
MATPTTLTLSCLVDGETTFNAFSVKAPPSGTVDDLKELIKAEIPNKLNGVDAMDLALWRVSIPDGDDNNKQPILLDQILEKKELKATRELSELFEGPLVKKTIHIIVQRPPPTCELVG